MYRFLLKPRWIAFHVLVLATIMTMISLAGWQLRRLHDRQEFNDRVTTNSDRDIAPIAEVLVTGASPAELEWRRVAVSGTYAAGEQVEVVNRSQDGQPGRNVVDVLILADGAAVLVNRGFVPSTEPAPATPEGSVEVIGRLRRSERRRTGQTDDASGVELRQVRRLDIAKLQPQVDQALLPMYVEQLQSRPAEGAWPAPVAAPDLGEGPHLSYAIQWIVFSVSVAAGWLFAVRRSAATLSGRRARVRKGSPPPIDDELSRELLERRQS
jgi:cytochrome oxidase assembly protein ShyY1